MRNRGWACIVSGVLGVLACVAFSAEPVSFSSGFVAVDDSATTLVSVSLGGRGGLVNATVINAEPNDLAECELDLKDSASGEFYSYVAGTQWSDPNYSHLVEYASTSPASLAAGGTAHVRFRIGAAYAFRISVNCASGETSSASVSGTAAAGDANVNKLDKWLGSGQLYVGQSDDIAAGKPASGDLAATVGGSFYVLPGKIGAAKLGYATDSMVMVQRGTSDAHSAMNLLAAYGTAKSLSPGGNTQAYNNRAMVLVPPGIYALGGSMLTMDGNFVTVAGLSTDPSATVISATGGTTVYMTGTHARMANLSLLNSTNGTFPELVGLGNVSELQPALRNVQLISGSSYPDNTIYVPQAGIVPVAWDMGQPAYHGGSLVVDIPCDDTTVWTTTYGTLTYDTTNWRRGGKTVDRALVLTATGGGSYARMSYALGGTLNSTNVSGLLECYYATADPNIQYTRFSLVDTAAKTRRFYLTNHTYAGKLWPAGWNDLRWYSPDTSYDDAGFDPSLVTSIRVQLDIDPSGQTPSVVVDSIKIFASERTKAVVSVHFDNLYAKQMKVLEKAAEYGIPVTLAATWNTLGQSGRLTEVQLRRAMQMGHKVIWYPNYCGLDWNNQAVPLAYWKLCLIGMAQWSRDKGFGNAAFMSPPGSQLTANTMSLFQSGFLQGLVWGATPYGSDRIEPLVGPVRIFPPTIVGTGTGLSAAITAAQPGGALVLRCCHVSSTAEQDQMMADLETIKAAVDGGTAVTCTVLDVYEGKIPE